MQNDNNQVNNEESEVVDLQLEALSAAIVKFDHESQKSNNESLLEMDSIKSDIDSSVLKLEALYSDLDVFETEGAKELDEVIMEGVEAAAQEELEDKYTA